MTDESLETIESPADDAEIVVSVIVPIRNRVNLLRDLLGALRAQTFPANKFELFVMDNQSTDDIESVVREFGETSGIRAHYHRMAKDGGPVPARNKGASMASGEFLAFTDSDCRPCEQWLELGVNAFTDGVGLVSGHVMDKPEQEPTFFSKVQVPLTGENPTYSCGNVFYRKSVFDEFGGFDVSLSWADPFGRSAESSDTDLGWRVKKGGYASGYVKDLIVYHEVDPIPPLLWLLDPTRIFFVPALVKRHPEIREKFMWGHYFFHKRSPIYYLALIVLIILAVIDLRLLLVAPLVILLRAIMRAKSISPVAIAREFMHVCFNLARGYVLCLTMLYGSLRYREIVL